MGRCFLPTGILASRNPLCLEPRFSQEHTALPPPLHSLLSPALPAQPVLYTLHELHPPHPKARSMEETFSRVLRKKDGKKDEEGKRDRSWGGGFGERNKSFQIHIFFSFFKIFIMTHVYNTKYLDQEQGCRDTKSTFIAGRKDK